MQIQTSNTGFSDLDITIILVSYNTRKMTLECVRSILEQTHSARYEVIVLDNASTDGSAEALRACFPEIKLIASRENLGFGKANNVAARLARGRRVLLLNPDTVILDRAIDRLCAFAEMHPDCRIWGGRTVFADGTLNPSSCWASATLWSVFCYATGLSGLKQSRLFNPEGYGGWKRDTVRAVDIVTGCFFLIDRDLWERLDGFDPQFFMYGEEADLCIRARKLGARPTITPTATIVHHGRASEPDRAEQRIKVLAGRITLMQRHRSRFALATAKVFYRMLPLLRLLGYQVAGLLLQKEDYLRSARAARHIWANRARWINGWNDTAIARAQGFLSVSPEAITWRPSVRGHRLPSTRSEQDRA
jgi:N-acetylglucosaminyl-diphospho-decaprenol L-rhamnosyltransferase